MSSSTSLQDTTAQFLSLSAPALPGKFTPIAFWAEEVISKPFVVTIEALSPQKEIDPAKLLHQPACLTVNHWEGPVRYFNGIVRRFTSSIAVARDQWSY